MIIQEIDNIILNDLIVQYYETNGRVPEQVFLSKDLYYFYYNGYSINTDILQTYSIDKPLPQQLSFWSSIGCTTINRYPKYKCFIFIGSREELNEHIIDNPIPYEYLTNSDIEFINREFEDIILSADIRE